jgi:hypothetical protein
MSTSIPAVDNELNIKHALLLDLTFGANVYYVSSAFKPITFDGNTYTELGSFLQLGEIQDDIKTTNGDIGITLSGVPQENLDAVLDTKVKGGEVIVRRAFFNDDYSLDSGNVVQRFKGVITNLQIEENYDILEGERTNSVSVSCSSIVTILENKTSGQRTSPLDRDRLFPGDQTFKRVPDLHNIQFDFGRESNGAGGSGGGGYGGGGWGGGFGGGINFNMR